MPLRVIRNNKMRAGFDEPCPFFSIEAKPANFIRCQADGNAAVFSAFLYFNGAVAKDSEFRTVEIVIVDYFFKEQAF